MKIKNNKQFLILSGIGNFFFNMDFGLISLSYRILKIFLILQKFSPVYVSYCVSNRRELTGLMDDIEEPNRNYLFGVP